MIAILAKKSDVAVIFCGYWRERVPPTAAYRRQRVRVFAVTAQWLFLETLSAPL